MSLEWHELEPGQKVQPHRFWIYNTCARCHDPRWRPVPRPVKDLPADRCKKCFVVSLEILTETMHFSNMFFPMIDLAMRLQDHGLVVAERRVMATIYESMFGWSIHVLLNEKAKHRRKRLYYLMDSPWTRFPPEINVYKEMDPEVYMMLYSRGIRIKNANDDMWRLFTNRMEHRSLALYCTLKRIMGEHMALVVCDIANEYQCHMQYLSYP